MNAPLRHPIALVNERPFAGRVRTLEVDWEKRPTIAQILDGQDVPRSFGAACICFVGDTKVPRELWGRVRPRAYCVRAGEIVNVTVIFTLPIEGPGGGGQGGGQKNTLTTVASIAVVLAAAAVAGPLGASVVGATLAPVAGAAVGIGGALAIRSLSPPPSLRSNQSASALDSGTNSAAALSGNVIAKGAPVPRVIGTMRVFPPIISPPLIEIVGDSTVAECVYGLAGPHAISGLLVGTTTEASIPDLQTEIQEGLPNSPILGLVTRQSYTDATAAVVLTQHQVDVSSTGGGVNLFNQTDPLLSCPQWDGLTSRTSPDEIWIAFNLASGLSNSGGAAPFVPIRIRIRQAGQSTWINLPEFHAVRTSESPFQFAAKLMFEATPPTVNLMPAAGGPVRAFYTVPTQNITPTGVGGWQADTYFYSGSGDTYLNWANAGNTSGMISLNCYTDRIEFYLSGAKFPKSGNWEIQIIRGQVAVDSQFVPSTYKLTVGAATNIYDFFSYYTSSGTFLAIYDQRTFADVVALARVSSIWNQPPVPDPTVFAVVAAKVTNRSIDQLSVLASGYVKDWDGSGWNTLTTTSNPAPHLYDVYAGSLSSTPLPVAVVDSAGLVAFRTLCNSKGYTCNAVVEGKSSLDVATMIAACAFGRPAHSELWGVTIDQDTSMNAPVQIFTPRNMSGFSVSKAFPLAPTGIRAGFNDASNNYLTNEIIVYADPNNPDNSRLEQISYDGLVNATDNAAVTGMGVSTRAKYDLNQFSLRAADFSGTAAVESVVCQKGDLIGLQYDTVDTYAGAAFVQAVKRSGGNIIGLTLDGTIPVTTGIDIATSPDLSTATDMADFGAQTGIAIRYLGGNGISTHALTGTGDLNTLTLATPFTDPGTSELDVGCLITAGRLGSEYRRLKVSGMTPKAAGQGKPMLADMTFVDEAQGLWP